MMVSFIDTVELSAQSATWLELLAGAAVKGTLLLIIAVILNFALRRASAASRHLVWSLALASLLALPLLSFGLPSWRLALLPGSLAKALPEAVTDSPEPFTFAPLASAPLPQGVETGEPGKSATVKQQAQTSAASLSQSPASEPPSEQTNSKPMSWASLALILWMTGALLILLRLLIGTASVWWMAQRARKITDGEWARLTESLASKVGLGRPVTLLKSRRITMPVTCGLVRSAILLPADADDWPDERRHVVLLHELAHVKRRDCLTQMLAQIACALYWFNPLIWAAARQLRMERERACDDQVLDAGTKASDYADHLLDLARSFRAASCSSLAAVAIARRSQLEGRLLAILDPNLSRRGLNPFASLSVGLIVAVIVLPLAAIRPSAQAHGKATPRAEATRSITFDSTGQTFAPESIAASRMTPHSIGQVAERQAEQAAQAPQAEMTQDAQAPQDEQVEEAAQKPQEQAAKPEQRDNKATIEALSEALKDEDAEVRQHALFALTQIGGPGTAEALAVALKDPNPEVRQRAAWGLGISHGEGRVDLLVGALRDSDAEVREKAAWALGLKGNQSAIQPLINALRDENGEVRKMAAWALGLKGNGQSVDPLIDALKDKDADVRQMAAWALGLRGDKRAAKALKAALKDEDKEVRKTAAWALGLMLMKYGEAVSTDNDLDVDVDTDSDSGSTKNINTVKVKARSKQN
jgi:beta-lactamase regulating signal transducer with metallopeptidase domain/HEAT repeat protein